MDYKNVIAPYLSNAKIKREADLFRENFWDYSIPVNIEDIIDIKLKIGIIPIPGF